jgi:hypothetical protein
MSYAPQGRRSFGPPVRFWIWPVGYVLLGAIAIGIVAWAQLSAGDGWLVRYIVEGDAHRIIGARALSIIFFLSGLAALVRTGMRGVVIHPEGIEARYVQALGWPKVKSCTWMEIDKVVFEATSVGLRLWDGSSLWLPEVSDSAGLKRILEGVASARAIPMKGGSAFPEPLEELAEE